MREKKKTISKYMQFYPSFKKAIDSLHDDKERLEAYEALTDLGLYEIKPSSTYERDVWEGHICPPEQYSDERLPCSGGWPESQLSDRTDGKRKQRN